MSLKYTLVKYPASISYTVTEKCEPLSTICWITFKILSMLAGFGKNICPIFLVSIKFLNLLVPENIFIGSLIYFRNYPFLMGQIFFKFNIYI